MLEVTDAKHQKDYRILITFNTGEQGEVDLREVLWGPVFEPLKDLDKFKRFKISPVLHTIVWDNDADLAPEFLYEKIKKQ